MANSYVGPIQKVAEKTANEFNNCLAHTKERGLEILNTWAKSDFIDFSQSTPEMICVNANLENGYGEPDTVTTHAVFHLRLLCITLKNSRGAGVAKLTKEAANWFYGCALAFFSQRAKNSQENNQ